MKFVNCTGVKIICTRKDGAITTWHDVLTTSVEDVVNEVKYDKNWIGGKITEIYLEFDDVNGKYYKTYLDVKKGGFNKLLAS